MQHCAGFISVESLYMFRAQAPIIRSILKLVRRPLVHVLSLQVSHHISLLGAALIRLQECCQVRLAGSASMDGFIAQR